MKPACHVDFVVCLFHALLLFSMHCLLLAGEFSNFPSYKSCNVPACTAHIVVCLCPTLLLILMHSQLLGGKLS